MISPKLFNWSKKVYLTLGVGTKLEPDVSSVLIFGGSTNGLGIELCTALMFENRVRVINVDTRDFEIILSVNEAVLLDKYYSFVHCDDFSNADSVVQAMREVFDLKIPVTVFINNVQQGLETIFDRSGDIALGDNSVSHLRKCVNANLTNVMIATKFFLEELVPQTIFLLKEKYVDFYIVNISTVLSLELPDFARDFTSSKAALNQFHDSLTSELKQRPGDSTIKTLLVYLPNLETGEDWEVALTELTQQLIQDLKDGKQGDTILHRNTGKSSVYKTRSTVLYKLGTFQHNWL